MSTSAPVRPELLAWALKRSGMQPGTARYEKFARWAAGEGRPPTLKQLQEFSRATHAPFGYLFLEAPPVESVPIPDFRTLGNHAVASPSADLLDTIYEAQQRQDWYRSFALAHEHLPLPFVGSVTTKDPVEQVADKMRTALGFTMDRRAQFGSWEEALRRLIDAVEQTGVLVSVSGIVGSNTHRTLDVNEFRGFALTDPLSSLIFVNGTDSKSAQMFTLMHELAHIWLGESALSDASMNQPAAAEHELWANKVAAEILVPLNAIKADYSGSNELPELQRLARRYKVSTLVILKRIFDAKLIQWETYQDRYDAELSRLMDIVRARKGSGGDYYNTQPLRIGQTLGRAVIIDALEGRTLFRDAFSLLGTAKRETFDGLASKLGVA